MEKLKAIAIVFLFIFGLFSAVAAAKPASVMLREGLYAEEVEGNIDAAIKIYEEIIQHKSASRDNVAQALYRQGMCCLKKKDDAGAKTAFRRLAAEYADQTEIVAKAKPLLNDLMNHDPADLMPSETLAYVELGNPGEQIETILTMLKGTPFENPLAAMGGNAAGADAAWKSPADILTAFMNPGMMAEFKKIKGMAIGVTAIRENGPSTVTVLYPGKSDALRGLIMMALSMAGTAGQPIEGMNTLNIENAVTVAYDDELILIAQPAEQLQWCVKQYKGLISEPTLASSNKSFAKIGKNVRNDSALTAWVNVDEVYAQALKAERNPQRELLQANAICDFNSIDECTFIFSVKPSGLNCKADVLFKDGHNSLAYGMIRTPNISRAALETVPSGAIAVASFALNQANGIQTGKVRKEVQNITGLDIGREIFANIKQVTVFITPVDKGFVNWSPFIPSFGLAIKSHDPQQTRRILGTLLGTANVVSDSQMSGTIDADAKKFLIATNNGKKIYCYMDQIGDTTIVSLNQNLIDASITAVKSKKNICNTGPLNNAVNKLPPATSKLVLVNVGGVLRLAGPVVDIGPLNDEQRVQLESNMEQIARAADDMTIEVRVDEQINNLTFNASITGIPPLNEVFGPASQIARIMGQAEAEAKSKKLRQTIAATIIKTAIPPIIDGNEEDLWFAAPQYKIANVIYAQPSSPDDLSANFRAMWDENNLYMLVDVTDDVLVNDTRPDQFVTLPTGSTAIPWWYDDCVEVYIDADNSKSNRYDNDDAQYHFDWDRTKPTMGRHNEHGRMENIEFAIVTTEKGYRTEIKFPWTTLGVKPSVGASIGGDIHINDDDDGGGRDSKIACNDKQDIAWDNPQAFGNAELAGLVGWWKLDETEGGIAKDSSGGNHNGILNGNAKWSKGKVGGAIELDGSGDFIRIDDKSAFDFGGQVTIACWVNIRSVPNEWAAIVTKGDSSWRLSTVQGQRKFHASVNSWNRFTVDGSTMVNTNEWHHVATVYDGKEMCIYIDGKLDVTKLWKGGIAKNDFNVLIGENAEQNGRFFDGLIDDVRVYNYALRQADIMALYNEGVKR